MGTAVARNAPCPCGSGKKYKHCCIDKAPPQQRKRLMVPIVLTLLALGLGAWVMVSRGISAGAAVGGGGLMIALIVYLFYDPPPPRGGNDHPAGINFGA